MTPDLGGLVWSSYVGGPTIVFDAALAGGRIQIPSEASTGRRESAQQAIGERALLSPDHQAASHRDHPALVTGVVVQDGLREMAAAATRRVGVQPQSPQGCRLAQVNVPDLDHRIR